MDETKREAAELLRRLRDRALTFIDRPTIRGMGSHRPLKAQFEAVRALRAQHYGFSNDRKDWVAAIDRAIATLEASP